jgi:hypothetical protein
MPFAPCPSEAGRFTPPIPSGPLAFRPWADPLHLTLMTTVHVAFSDAAT